MAAHYVAAIRKVCAHGPYSLLGYCLGSYVALEMAVQIQELGEPVEFLV
jgi:thioesterase domain-containing protein